MGNTKSKTEIKKHLRRKTNPELIETIREALRNPNWNDIAKILSGSTRKQSSINLFEIDKQTTEGDTVLVIGKVLSQGEITKKIRICSLSISKSARDKLNKTKSEFVSVLEEIKKNPKAEGIKILR